MKKAKNLEELIEEATVDCHDGDKQRTGFCRKVHGSEWIKAYRKWSNYS